MLLQADFVTLHAPLTDDTRSLINADRLHLMKRGVRIVNAARGDLVDIDALVERSSRARLPAPRSTSSPTSRTRRAASSSSRTWS